MFLIHSSLCKLPPLPGYTKAHLELHIHLGYIPFQERCELCSVRFLSAVKGDLERSCRKWPLASLQLCFLTKQASHHRDPSTFQLLLHREGIMLNYGHNLLSNKVKNVKSCDFKLCGMFWRQKSISIELEHLPHLMLPYDTWFHKCSENFIYFTRLD